MGQWDDDDFEAEQSNLVKNLRKEIRERDRRLQEKDEQLAELLPKVRAINVASALTDLGVTNPKVARLVPESVKADKAELAQWLEEFKDILPLGSKPSAEAPPEASGADEEPATPVAGGIGSPNVPPEFMAAMARMAAGEPGSTPVPVDRDSADVKFLNDLRGSAKSLDEVIDAYRKVGPTS